MGIIRGYVGPNSFCVYWNILTNEFKLFRYQQTSLSKRDTDTTTLIGNISEVHNGTVLLK